ncbi:ADP-ribosylglycohydrolase family protein [Kitasatospora camelliae]|uniref:ADP-ribosylglycohydrolase family protein n=1 Tax=Kitasatospora camelliae TaxID=3156397 RepID=A0AAU8JQU1_9ACTN
MIPSNPALDSLHGLSVGDALGAQFFVPDNRPYLARRQAPPAPWPWTDDTEMACSVHAAQTERGRIDSFDLTHAFARRQDFDRGYGPAAGRLLRLIREGGDARVLAAELFDGQGSLGNGAAMRTAPLGAAHAADPAAAVEPAAATALITHTHPQAVAGAVAVAVAAAVAARARTVPTTGAALLRAVTALTPAGPVRDAIGEAAGLLDIDDHHAVAALLGNGSRVTALDTVPFALWTAARHLDDYPQAIWTAISAGGDVDTTAAIVGGIVAARTGTTGIPADWLAAREPLPAWATPPPGSVATADGHRHLTPIRRPRPATVPADVGLDLPHRRRRPSPAPRGQRPRCVRGADRAGTRWLAPRRRRPGVPSHPPAGRHSRTAPPRSAPTALRPRRGRRAGR